MNLFDDELPLAHVERANHESRNIFSNLRTDKVRMLQAFGIPFDPPDIAAAWSEIDLSLAWSEFDLLSYETMFKETGGDLEMLYDPSTRSRILSKILSKWPINYYMKRLTSVGIMNAVDLGEDTLYFFKDAHKDSINTLSKASDTLQPS
ncbi:MAG: hypothetical protein ACMG6E_07605 [Candidatus Roizmanbacteria bacterium]